MSTDKVSEIQVPGADNASGIAEELEMWGYKQIAEGEELKPGFYEFWSGEDENGKESSGVNFIALPGHEDLARKLTPTRGADDE